MDEDLLWRRSTDWFPRYELRSKVMINFRLRLRLLYSKDHRPSIDIYYQLSSHEAESRINITSSLYVYDFTSAPANLLANLASKLQRRITPLLAHYLVITFSLRSSAIDVQYPKPPRTKTHTLTHFPRNDIKNLRGARAASCYLS